jgi:chemotaxis response regulator CheB
MSTVRVLVIDDSLTIRAILEAILLQERDIEIVGLAGDVAEARLFLAERRPDIITLDLAMPEMDGMSYLAELAQGPHAPVIVVSSLAKANSEATRAALAAGAVACFDKARLVAEAARFVRVVRKAAERFKGVPAPV